jgi:spermidine synthase
VRPNLAETRVTIAIENTVRPARLGPFCIIAIAALATGAWEVIITQVASVLFFNHIAYLVIAICLFAFGVGGLIARYTQNERSLLVLLLLSCLTVYPLINYTHYAWYLCLFATPFLLFGWLTTLIWMKLTNSHDRAALYAIDMSAMFIGLVMVGPLFLSWLPVNVLGDAGIINHLKETVQQEGMVNHRSHTNHFARTDFLETEKPSVYYMFTDGMFVTRSVVWDGHTPMFKNPHIESLASMKRLAFAAGPKEDVALLGAGAGFDIAIALQAGSIHIDAVEINPTTITFAQALESQTGGVLRHPSVSLHVTDARSFIRQSAKSWDHINLALLQTSPASGRGRQHVDARMITREALQDYRDHLNELGIIAIIQNSPGLASATDNVIRAVFTFDSQILRFRHNAFNNPFSHLILARDEPFTIEEISRLTEEAKSLDIKYITSFEDYNTTHVASDDRPFLFEQGANFPHHATLIVAVSLLLLLLWLIHHRSNPSVSSHSILSFLTGVIMMSAQVLIIYRCQSVIGSTTTALAVGLAAMMLGAGSGALLSQFYVLSIN